MSEPILKVVNLVKHFPVRGGIFLKEVGRVHALNDVSLEICHGETLGIVGESGCGKSTLGRTLLRLHEPTSGQICFDGEDITTISQKKLRPKRKEMQMVFQDPFESLNARHTVGEILEEPFIIHQVGSSAERKQWVKQLLNKVELPQTALNKYIHEFSGGQRQRIGIARAIALNPKLIVCDEPVSALDVSIQSQILNLLMSLQQEMGLTYLFIAHDLAVVKHISDKVAVMYLGKIVEYTSAETIYRSPQHPYTRALISAIPVPSPGIKKHKIILKGDVPSPLNPPSGCKFHTRCPMAQEICKHKEPKLKEHLADSRHFTACHFATSN